MRSALALLTLVALARALAGQGLKGTELDLGTAASWAKRDFYGLSAGIAIRPGSQGRVDLTAAGGSLDGSAAVRLEATAQFLVTPGAKSGVSPYGGLGVAFLGARGVRGTGALVALIGLEAAAGRRSGWFGDLGFGGGVWLRLGYRWRRLPPW